MALAVASSTLILVVIFVPIIFFSEDVRRQFADVAFTVVVSLLASLAVATTVVPLLATRIPLMDEGDGKDRWEWEKRLSAWWRNRHSRMSLSGIQNRLSKRRFTAWIPAFAGMTKGHSYESLVRRATAFSVRKRGWVMLGVLLSLLLSAAIYAFKLPKEFTGGSDKNEFIIFVELPSGTKLDVSDKIVAAVESEINGLPEVKNVVKTISSRVEGWSSKIYVTLSPTSERSRTTQDVIDALRPRLKSIGAEYEAFIYFSEPQSAKELTIDVFGKDYLTLRDVAVELAKHMQEVPGLRDVKLRYKPGRPEIRLDVDHTRASLFGLTSKEIADTLHAEIRGLRATYFNAGHEQVETVARLSEEDRRTVEHISNLTLVSNTKKRHLVPVQQVIEFQNDFTPSEVWRRNKERVIQVSANRERLALSTAVERVKAALKGVTPPLGYHYEFGGDYKKLVKSEREFLTAFIVMAALVYMVLACFFESYSQPLLMLLTIPLATAGSMPVLWMTRTSVNIGVYIGLLMLGGIVVSNAVILIDRLNGVRQRRGLLRSVLKVGIERSEPIFMTSLTTIAAMLPLTLEKGESADMWAPLALTVVSGIAVSSVLTLFVIPAAYVILEDVMRGWGRLTASAFSAAAPGAAGSSRSAD